MKDSIKEGKLIWLFFIGCIIKTFMLIFLNSIIGWFTIMLYEIIWLSLIIILLINHNLIDDPIIVDIINDDPIIVDIIDDPIIVDIVEDDPIIVEIIDDDPIIVDIVNLSQNHIGIIDDIPIIIDHEKVCNYCGVANNINANNCMFCGSQGLILYIY